MSSSDTIKEFLTALFEYKQDDQHVLIWTLPSKESFWHTNIKYAAATTRELCADGQEVYFGLGLAAKDYGAHARVKADQVVAIPGLWMDIDLVSDTAHKKANLPATVDDAMKILEPMPASTMVVHSGHGLHVYWLFKEVWTFDTPAERQKAEALVQGFSAAIQVSAGRLGYRLDSTVDLARVLRVAGTTNFKGGQEKPVFLEILVVDGAPVPMAKRPRYDPSELEDYTLKVEDAAGSQPPEKIGGLIVSADAHPPFDKFEALQELDQKFRASWARTRKDMKDESPSAYDMSLANLAKAAGWTDQEVVDLLIGSRRKHGDDLKLREDYYRRTLGKVKTFMNANGLGDEDLEDVLAIVDAPARRVAALQALSEKFGMRVDRIIKHKTASPIYHIVLDGGEVELGSTQNLLDQRLLRYKIFDATNRQLPGFGKARWIRMVDIIGAAIEDEEADEATTVAGMATTWMRGYFSSHVPSEDMKYAITERSPFKKDGALYFFLDDFRQFVRVTFNENLSSPKASMRLKRAGARRQTIALSKSDNPRADKPTTISVWEAPGA